MEVNRLENWKEFSAHMEQYIKERVEGKYGASDTPGVDLMAFTDERECLYSILKYAIRLWNGRGKEHDLKKIAHYAEIAYTKRIIQEAKNTG